MITIDLDSGVPLTDQLVDSIRRAIATRQLRPGDELPPVRQVATDLAVNLNTVARAYRVLEGSGLVRTARGRRTRVVASTETETASAPDRLRAALERAFADARLAAIERTEAEAHVRAALAAIWPHGRHRLEGAER